MMINQALETWSPDHNQQLSKSNSRVKLNSTPESNSPSDNKELHSPPQQNLSGAGSPPPKDPNDPPSFPKPNLNDTLEYTRTLPMGNKFDPDLKLFDQRIANVLVDFINKRELGTRKQPLETETFNFIIENSPHRDFSNLVFCKGLFINFNEFKADNLKISFKGAELIDAAMTFLPNMELNFADADLERSVLGFAQTSPYGYLNNSDFSGANLKFTKIKDLLVMNSNFSNANLYGTAFKSTRILNCDLSKANFGFTSFPFSSISESNLEDANFSNTYLERLNFTSCNLKNVDFSNSYLYTISKERNMFEKVENMDKVKSFEGARLIGLDLPEELKGKFSISKNKKDLSNLNLSFINFSNQNFDGYDFSGSLLKEAVFDAAKLRSAVFNGSSIIGTRFFGTDLARTKFDESSLIRTSFHQAMLNNVAFENSFFYNAIFNQCNFENLEFKSSKFGDQVRIVNINELNRTVFLDCSANSPLTNTLQNFESNTVLSDLGQIDQKDFRDLNLRFVVAGDFLNDMFENTHSQGYLIICALQDKGLSGSDLSHAHFADEDLSYSNFSNCDLNGINLNSSNLEGTKLKGALFNNSSLVKADCMEADFEAANILGDTSFKGANVQDALNVPKAIYYKGAIGIAKDPNFKLEVMLKLERKNRAKL